MRPLVLGPGLLVSVRVRFVVSSVRVRPLVLGPGLLVSVRVRFVVSSVRVRPLVLGPGRLVLPVSMRVLFVRSVLVRPARVLGPGGRVRVLVLSVVGHSVTGGQVHSWMGGHVGCGGQVGESVTLNSSSGCALAKPTQQRVTATTINNDFIAIVTISGSLTAIQLANSLKA